MMLLSEYKAKGIPYNIIPNEDGTTFIAFKLSDITDYIKHQYTNN